METATENIQQQCKDSISVSLSSRSSSITSDSSDGNSDIRRSPLPKPPLSQKQRDASKSSVSSCSSVNPNNIVDLPGYVPNRIPSSVFSNKTVNSAEWSIPSNESLFSIYDGNFISSKEDFGLKLAEMPKSEETVNEITEINQVPLPPVNKTNEFEKETVLEKKPYQMEISDSEIDDNEEIEEYEIVELDDEHKEGEVSLGIRTEDSEVEVVENKQEDFNSTTSNSPCRSDTSIASFAFPVLKKEDGVEETPSMKIRGNVNENRRSEYQQPESQSQRERSKQFESQKALRNSWFSCFHCPSKCGLFK